MHRRIVVLIVLLSLLLAQAMAGVTVGGSDTLILLGQRWASNFQRSSPTITVTVRAGTGSVAALREGKIQVLQTQHRLPTAQRAGLVELPVGLEAVVVYVNSANPVSELTVAQLRDIYLGKITNWNKLGGPDKPIELFAGESSGDTLAYFQESVLNGQEPYPFWGKSTTKELLDVIASKAWAIGYAGMGGAPGVKPLRIRDAAGAREATATNVRSGSYPLSRYLYWYLANGSGEPRVFSEWVLGSEGQIVVESLGFLPLNQADRQTALGRLKSGGAAR